LQVRAPIIRLAAGAPDESLTRRSAHAEVLAPRAISRQRIPASPFLPLFGDKPATFATLRAFWDEAAVLTGVKFAAVKKDVYVQMDLRLLGEAKARALVSKAMSRI
jgi:hypothetical protein